MDRPSEHDAPSAPPQPPANGSASAAGNGFRPSAGPPTAESTPGPAPTPPPAADAEALRGTRFEFGGRRPYSFTPPRVSLRASSRPLPGIGTVALGQVTRIVPYGAFVDFLGFRGMIHVSQLTPGQRVERVEDVVQLHDEVQIRVIGVDPERRHINLTLVNKVAPGQAPPPAAAPEAAAPAAGPEPVAPATTEGPVQDSAPRERSDAQRGFGGAAPAGPAEARQIELGVQGSGASAASRAPAGVRGSAPARPAPTQRRPVPKPAPKPTTQPAIAQRGARAVRRELADPRHPMARLLASAPESVVRPTTAKERAHPEDEIVTPAQPSPIAAPEPPRPVHVFGPDPEPEEERPATVEALAARFGQKRESAQPKGHAPKNGSDRSRQEREKQAQILAKLREDAAKFAK